MSDRPEEREKGLFGGATPEAIALAVLRYRPGKKNKPRPRPKTREPQPKKDK